MYVKNRKKNRKNPPITSCTWPQKNPIHHEVYVKIFDFWHQKSNPSRAVRLNSTFLNKKILTIPSGCSKKKEKNKKNQSITSCNTTFFSLLDSKNPTSRAVRPTFLAKKILKKKSTRCCNPHFSQKSREHFFLLEGGGYHHAPKTHP